MVIFSIQPELMDTDMLDKIITFMPYEKRMHSLLHSLIGLPVKSWKPW